MVAWSCLRFSACRRCSCGNSQCKPPLLGSRHVFQSWHGWEVWTNPSHVKFYEILASDEVTKMSSVQSSDLWAASLASSSARLQSSKGVNWSPVWDFKWIKILNTVDYYSQSKFWTYFGRLHLRAASNSSSSRFSWSRRAAISASCKWNRDYGHRKRICTNPLPIFAAFCQSSKYFIKISMCIQTSSNSD